MGAYRGQLSLGEWRAEATEGDGGAKKRRWGRRSLTRISEAILELPVVALRRIGEGRGSIRFRTRTTRAAFQLQVAIREGTFRSTADGLKGRGTLDGMQAVTTARGINLARVQSATIIST